MKNESAPLINYKGTDITIRELATLSGNTYGKISAARKRHPTLNGEQLLNLKRRKQATYKGITKSHIEWADELNVSITSLRLKIGELGEEKALSFYKNGEHSKHQRKTYRTKNEKINDVDLSSLEFDTELHANNLLQSGLNYAEVARRMNDAGLL